MAATGEISAIPFLIALGVLLWVGNPGEEVAERGWDDVDVVFVTGDAYVDHPSFAMAILGRVLEAAGFRVDRCGVEAVEGFPMDAVYLEASKETGI